MSKAKHLLLVFLLCSLVPKLQAQKSANETQASAIFNKAHDLFQKEKFEASKSLFLDYLHEGQNELMRSDARYYIAICATEMLLANTEHLHLRFREHNPENTKVPVSHFSLGQYYFNNKRYRLALFEFIEVDPYMSLSAVQAESYYFMAGYSQFYEENYREAQAYFDEIVDYQNEYFHLANYFTAYISFEFGEFDKALKGFNEVKDHPNFKDFVPLYIAEVYANNEEYEKVVSYGEEILENPDLQKRHVVELLMAQAHFKLENWQKAKDKYESYSKLRKLSSEDAYQYAYSAYITKDYDESIKQFESLVINDDSLGQNVAYHLADAYLKKGKKLEARNSFQFARKLSFDKQIQEDALFQYAKLSHELKFNKAAMNSFQQFIKQYPKSKHIDEAKVILTRLLLSSNNYLEALAIIEKIPDPTKKIDEGYQRLAYNIGLEYLDAKNREKAREYLNRSLKRGPVPAFRALAHFWIGESLFNEDRYGEALKSYKNYLFIPESKSIPLTAIAHYNVAYCYLKQEEYKDALFHFENYFDSENEIYNKQFDSDAHLRTADCYFSLGVYDKAIANYKKAIEKDYSGLDYAYYQLGMIKGLQKNPEQKIEWMEKLTKEFPRSGYIDDALFEMANEKFILGNKKQALREFVYLNQDFPNNVYEKVSLLKIGIIYYQLDESDKAITTFKKVVDDFPSSPESRQALKAIKDIYVDWGRADEYFNMIDTLNTISVTAGEKDSALFTSALSQLKRGDCSKSIDAFNTYLSSFSKGVFAIEALYYKGDCHYQLNEFEAALESFDQIIERQPNSHYVKALEKASALCYEADSFSRAIPYLKKQSDVVNSSRELLSIYEALAKCYLELNQCDEAEKYLRRIEKFDDAEPEILEKADYTLARCAMKNSENEKAIEIFKKIAEQNGNKLGAESQYLASYLYYVEEQYDSSKANIIRLKNNFSSYDYFVAKGFILMADNYSKQGDDFNAKAILQSIIENYEGDDLVTKAQEKLEAIEKREQEKEEELEEIQRNQEDTIKFNEK